MNEVLLDELDGPRWTRTPGDFRRHPLTGATYVYNIDGELTADGKKVRSELYGRASSRGERLVDRFALERRDARLIVTGLRLLIERGEPLGDDLDALVGRCLATAGAWLSADRGTALHALWEDAAAPIDHEALGLSPELLGACRMAIERCLERHGIEVLVHEWKIVNDLLRAAGTADAFGRLTRDLTFGDGVVIAAGTVIVLDLKSGVLRLEGGRPLYWMPYTVQLAIYAGGCRYVIDGDDEHRETFPWPVSQRWGLILHVGIEAALDTDVAAAQLWKADLGIGRRGAELVLDIADWGRQHAFCELGTAPVAVTVETEGPSQLEQQLAASLELEELRRWLQARIDVCGQHAASRLQLQFRWPPEVPTLRASRQHTVEQLAAIETALDDVEAACSVPFGPSKPGSGRDPVEHLLDTFPNSQLITKEPSNVQR